MLPWSHCPSCSTAPSQKGCSTGGISEAATPVSNVLLLKEHTPTKWQGGPHRLSRAQHNKQANKQTHLTAKKESPKAAADFPPVPVVISHQITAL